jgi:uncharacterized protein (DUF302 family)
MTRRILLSALLAVAVFVSPLAAATPDGLETRASNHSVAITVSRFVDAVRAAGWVVFAEIDHAAAAQAVHMPLPPRTVVLFGNPAAGTPAMRAHPTLAIDLPMRVLVWADEQGRTFVTRSTGEDTATRVYARHGVVIPPDARRGMSSAIEGMAREAAE